MDSKPPEFDLLEGANECERSVPKGNPVYAQSGKGQDRGIAAAVAHLLSLLDVQGPVFQPASRLPLHAQLHSEHRRFVVGSDALGKLDSVAILETICDDAHEHIFDRFGRMPRNANFHRFVNAAIDVGKVDAGCKSAR